MIQYLSTEQVLPSTILFTTAATSILSIKATPSISADMSAAQRNPALPFSPSVVLINSTTSSTPLLSGYSSDGNFVGSVSRSLNFSNSGNNLDKNNNSMGKKAWPITIIVILTIILAVISLLVISVVFLLQRKKFMSTFGDDFTRTNSNYECKYLNLLMPYSK